MPKLNGIQVLIAMLLAAMLATVAVSCTVNRSVGAYQCQDPFGRPTICAGVTITIYHQVSYLDADTVFQTREVDPNVFDNNPDVDHVGTVTLTLSSGATVSHTQNLVLDSSAYLTPITAGYDVLAYRPQNPSSLQSFLDQYLADADQIRIESTVALLDISGGSQEESVIDSQGAWESDTDYHGSVNVALPSFEGPGGPFVK